MVGLVIAAVGGGASDHGAGQAPRWGLEAGAGVEATRALPAGSGSCVSLGTSLASVQRARRGAAAVRTAFDRSNACGTMAGPSAGAVRIGQQTFGSLEFDGFTGGTSLDEVRLHFGTGRDLALGVLGRWRLAVDAFIGRLMGRSADAAIDQKVHASLDRAVGERWNLGMDLYAASRGGLDVTRAERSTGIAAHATYTYRPPQSDAEHKLELRLAADARADRPAGLREHTMLASAHYSYKVGPGTVGAELSLARTQAKGGPGRSEARGEVRFSHPF